MQVTNTNGGNPTARKSALDQGQSLPVLGNYIVLLEGLGSCDRTTLTSFFSLGKASGRKSESLPESAINSRRHSS